MIEDSLVWHMKKGTKWAILKALSMIGIVGEFLLWKDTGDDPRLLQHKLKINPILIKTDFQMLLKEAA